MELAIYNTPRNVSFSSTSDFPSAICHLYFLVVNADGQVDEKEERLGKIMAEAEGINQVFFDKSFEELQTQSKEFVFRNCLKFLRKLSEERQIKALAWICVLANADGFMDKSEWALIYSIYHNELNLSLPKIMEEQRKINGLIFGKTGAMFGIKVNH
jgi:uncharacterized tellurite resistance protein B-like protein